MRSRSRTEAVGDDCVRAFGDVDAAVDAFEQMPVIVVVTEGPDLKTVAFNAATRSALQDRLVHGQPMLEGFGAELGGQGLTEVYGAATATGETAALHEVRVQLHQPDGVQEVFFDISASPRRDGEGHPRGTIVVVTDVTERVLKRRAADLELTELRAKYAEAQGNVRAMQRALLADAVPVLPSFDIAARYVLAADEEVAGGDWFDAIAGEDGSVTLVVGDVVGHGRAAAVAMGQLRSVLLSQLRAERGITEALTFLDGFAAGVPDASRATVCVVRIDRSGGVEYCTAGHPPPLLLAAAGENTGFLPPSGAGPLGTGAGFATARAHVLVGEAIVLYSDGIVERPGVTPAAASLELLSTASGAHRNVFMPAGASRSAAERICSLSIELLTRITGHNDDITIVAAERRPDSAPLEVEMAVGPDAASHARTALRSWLTELGPDVRDVDAVLQATTELVANVIDHAYLAAETSPFVMRARLERTGDVVVDVHDEGSWKPPVVARGRGRGLAMVRQLVDTLTLQHTAVGTAASIRHPLTRAAGLLDWSTPMTIRDPEHFDVWAEGGPRPVITIVGPLDGSTVVEAAAHINIALTEAATTVTVDLTDVSLLASAGVDLLYRVTEQADTLGLHVDLITTGGTPAQHVLTLVGLPYQAAVNASGQQ